MAIIYTYPKLTNPQGNELIVVTDVNNKNSTRLITVADIAGLIPSGPGGCTEAIKGITDATGLGILYEAVACSYPKFQSTDNSILITSTGINDGLDFVVADAGCDNVFSTVTADGGGDPIVADGCDDILDFTSLDNSVTIVTSGNDVDFSVASSPGEGCTTAITSLFPSSGDNIIADACDFGVMLTGTGGITVTGSAPDTITFNLDYTIPCATNANIGGFHANVVGIGPPSASETGTYYPVEITEVAPCTGIVRIPDSATIDCASTVTIGGVKVGADGVDVQPQISGYNNPEWVQLNNDCGAFVNIPAAPIYCATWNAIGGVKISSTWATDTIPGPAISDFTAYPVETTVMQEGEDCTAIVRIPNQSPGDGCVNAWSTITTPDGGFAVASGCNQDIDFDVEVNSNLTIETGGTDLTFGLGCATEVLIGGIKIKDDPLQISPPAPALEGTYYPVQVTDACEGVVRVPDATLPGGSGTFTPILMTQGGNGTAFVPLAYNIASAGITYTQASGYYQIVGNIVYMDFFLEFVASGNSLTVPLQKSLGIGWDDAGTLKHLGQLPGLTDLNINQPNNTTVTISRAECYTVATGDVDPAEWEVMPQTGMLNRYPDIITPGVEPFMWLAGHIYVDDPINSKLQTNYSPDKWITLTTNDQEEPTQKAILAGSMTAVLRSM